MPALLDRLLNHAGNFVRDNFVLTPEEIREREAIKRPLEMIKIASIIGALAGLFFFAIFPNIFTLILAGVIAFSAKEIFTAAENLLGILNEALTEWNSRSSREEMIKQISKNTLLVGPLLRAFAP